MNWAAKRKTKRQEDMAYYLMGLFGVYMPMLYGEGDRAFYRLQEEIMKTLDDRSIFCWISLVSSRATHRSLLARAPAEFAACGKIGPIHAEKVAPFQMTNKGLMIELQFMKVLGDKERNEYRVLLREKNDSHEIYY